jgi:hypothetical protein
MSVKFKENCLVGGLMSAAKPQKPEPIEIPKPPMPPRD